MLKRVIILMLFSCLLISCSRLHHTSTLSLNQFTAPFSRVTIIGHIDVTLHTNATRSQVLCHGDPQDCSHVKWSVAHHELRIDLDKQFTQQGPVHVDILSPSLTSLTYQGSGILLGHNLRSRSLALFVQNNGQTRLDGQLNLHHVVLMGSGQTKIQGIQSQFMQLALSGQTHAQLIGVAHTATVRMTGDSRLSLYWVNSPVLKLRLEEQAFAQIAGVATRLDAELWGHSQFNGRYLRAQHAFVKTHDSSFANMAALCTQHTLATGTSTIYYYDLPDMNVDFMAEDGSVLDMREWGAVNRS